MHNPHPSNQSSHSSVFLFPHPRLPLMLGWFKATADSDNLDRLPPKAGEKKKKKKKTTPSSCFCLPNPIHDPTQKSPSIHPAAFMYTYYHLSPSALFPSFPHLTSNPETQATRRFPSKIVERLLWPSSMRYSRGLESAKISLIAHTPGLLLILFWFVLTKFLFLHSA